MTKFIDTTREKTKDNRKRTTFEKAIGRDGGTSSANTDPTEWDVVKLIRRRDGEYPFDLMVAYDGDKEGKSEGWYLGKWNDGC